MYHFEVNNLIAFNNLQCVATTSVVFITFSLSPKKTMPLLSSLLLIPMVSTEKLFVNLIEDPFYVMDCFFLYPFKILCLLTIWLCVLACNMCLSFLEFIEILWLVHLCLLSNLGCFPLIFSKNYFCSFLCLNSWDFIMSM